MNKRFLSIIIVIAVVIVVLLAIILNQLTKNASVKNSTAHATPGQYGNVFPTGVGTIRTTSLMVISTSPKDQAKGVGVKPNISITFNKTITDADVKFSSLPAFDFTTQIISQTLVITPKDTLQPGTYYTYIVKYPKLNDSSTTYHFTTEGPTQQFLPDTRPQGMVEEDNQFQLANHPDVYLKNQLPHEGNSYTISSQFVSGSPSGHFQFTVTSKTNKDAAKTEFTQWAQGLGLSVSQIQSLDVTYQ